MALTPVPRSSSIAVAPLPQAPLPPSVRALGGRRMGPTASPEATGLEGSGEGGSSTGSKLLTPLPGRPGRRTPGGAPAGCTGVFAVWGATAPGVGIEGCMGEAAPSGARFSMEVGRDPERLAGLAAVGRVGAGAAVAAMRALRGLPHEGVDGGMGLRV